MRASAEARSTTGALTIVVGGDWSLDDSPPRFSEVVTPRTTPDARTLVFDGRALGTWDSSLLVFLWQGQQFCESRQLQCETSTLPEQVNRLLALARAVPEHPEQDHAPRPRFPARVGMAALAVVEEIRMALSFLGEVVLSALAVLTRRARIPWRDTWVVVQANSSGALPIVTLIAVLVGVIIAFLGVVVLRRFGAGYYVSYLVGFGMLRELAALMTGIIMAGRTGAAFAAELGSMKITEEIDAFTTLGLSPVNQLVLPRMLGVFVMMPLLVIYADFIGIVGGMVVSRGLLDLSFRQFLNGLLTAVTLSDALLGVFKAVVYGAIVGFAGCLRGMQTGADASAVGRATTSAVVLGITLIIMANALIDWLAALLDI